MRRKDERGLAVITHPLEQFDRSGRELDAA